MSEPQSMAGIPRADRYAQQADDRTLEHFRKIFADVMTRSRTSTHSEQIDAIAGALAKAQAKFEAPKRKRTVETGKFSYTYADLQDVYDSVRKPLADNGLAITHLCQEFAGQVELVTMLTHESGQWFKSIYPVRAKTDSPQTFGSAMTYAKRYSVSALLGIASEEDDDGAAAEKPEPVEKPTPAKQRAKPAPQAPKADAEPLSVMLDGGEVREFPRNKGGVLSALAALEQACNETPETWGANSDLAWKIAREMPDLEVRQGTTARQLVEFLESMCNKPELL